MAVTAADLLYGRGGGRHIPPNAVLPGINDVETGPAICPHGHRFTHVAQRDLGKPCIVDGHPVRRPTKAELARAPHVILTAHVPPERCPCGAPA